MSIFNLMGVLCGGIMPPFPIDESCTVSSSTSTKSGSIVEAVHGNMSFIKLKSITDNIPLDEGCGLAIYVTQARLIVLATAPNDNYARWLAENAKDPVSNPQSGIYVTVFYDTVWSGLQKFIAGQVARQTANYVPPEAVFRPVPTLSPEQLSFYGPLASGNASAMTAATVNAAPQDNQPRNLDSVEAEIADTNADFDIDVPIPDVPAPAPVSAPASMSASDPEQELDRLLAELTHAERTVPTNPRAILIHDEVGPTRRRAAIPEPTRDETIPTYRRTAISEPTRDETRPTYRRTIVSEPADEPEEKGLAVRMAESLVGLFPKKDRAPAQRRRSEPTPQNSSELDWSSLYGPKV